MQSLGLAANVNLNMLRNPTSHNGRSLQLRFLKGSIWDVFFVGVPNYPCTYSAYYLTPKYLRKHSWAQCFIPSVYTPYINVYIAADIHLTLYSIYMCICRNNSTHLFMYMHVYYTYVYNCIYIYIYGNPPP